MLKIMLIFILFYYSVLLPQELSLLSTIKTGIFNDSGAEICAYDSLNKRILFTNASDNAIEVYDISNPLTPEFFATIENIFGSGINSIAIYDSLLGAAVESDPITENGKAVFFNLNNLDFLFELEVGPLPDMITFTHNGSYALIANEGEPLDGDNPAGSVSIIDILNQSVKTIDLSLLDINPKVNELRLFPDFDPGETLEPEYIAVDEKDSLAYVTLQENNGILVIDILNQSIADIFSLGIKEHSLENFALDASDRDDKVNISNWPLFGMFMPDAIAAYSFENETYLITANEGDSKGEEERIKNVSLDETMFPNASELKKDENIGRLEMSLIDGDFDSDGDYDSIFVYGARSFSIWSASGDRVFDSGQHFEEIIASLDSIHFNSNNDDNNSFDSRSDNKGPEPEGVTLGRVGDKTYAFILLERIGGIMVYDVSEPEFPHFEGYFNNRDFEGEPEFGTAGDLGPEGAVFIPSSSSPNGNNLLAVANEVSGSVSIFEFITETVSVKNEKSIPDNFILNQNFPNPFNPITTISYSLPTEEIVNISVFDALGSKIKELVNEITPAGSYTIRFDASGLASGNYYYRMIAGNFAVVKKLMLIK